MNEISPLVSHVIPSRCTWRTLFGKCVSIVVYAHFLLSDKKNVSYSNMCICFYAILQNAHRNRWMEMQLVTALKYETQIFHKFIRCLFDNSYISYLGLCICFIFCKALLDPVFHVIAMQRFDFKNSIIAIKWFLMILNLCIYPQHDFKVWLYGGCFKGDIRCPSFTSWYASLGSSWNGLWSCKTTPSYRVKNSSVHSDSFRCMSL